MIPKGLKCPKCGSRLVDGVCTYKDCPGKKKTA